VLRSLRYVVALRSLRSLRLLASSMLETNGTTSFNQLRSPLNLNSIAIHHDPMIRTCLKNTIDESPAALRLQTRSPCKSSKFMRLSLKLYGTFFFFVVFDVVVLSSLLFSYHLKKKPLFPSHQYTNISDENNFLKSELEQLEASLKDRENEIARVSCVIELICLLLFHSPSMHALKRRCFVLICAHCLLM
jgi:hypothetical protein